MLLRQIPLLRLLEDQTELVPDRRFALRIAQRFHQRQGVPVSLNRLVMDTLPHRQHRQLAEEVALGSDVLVVLSRLEGVFQRLFALVVLPLIDKCVGQIGQTDTSLSFHRFGRFELVEYGQLLAPV